MFLAGSKFDAVPTWEGAVRILPSGMRAQQSSAPSSPVQPCAAARELASISHRPAASDAGTFPIGNLQEQAR